MLELELGPLGKTVSDLNCCAISPVHLFAFYDSFYI